MIVLYLLQVIKCALRLLVWYCSIRMPSRQVQYALKLKFYSFPFGAIIMLSLYSHATFDFISSIGTIVIAHHVRMAHVHLTVGGKFPLKPALGEGCTFTLPQVPVAVHGSVVCVGIELADISPFRNIVYSQQGSFFHIEGSTAGTRVHGSPVFGSAHQHTPPSHCNGSKFPSDVQWRVTSCLPAASRSDRRRLQAQVISSALPCHCQPKIR